MNDAGRIIDDGAIAIAERRIVDVGEDAAVTRRYSADRVIDAKGAPVHPGLIECHIHASTLALRGTLPDHIVEDDLFDIFDCPYYNNVTDEEEYFGVVLAAIEMIRNDTTCFMEAGTVLEPSAAAQAAELVGIRALIADAFIWDQPGGFAQGKGEQDGSTSRSRGVIERAPKTIDEALKRLGQELKRNSDQEALVTGHVAVLGLGTASEELLLEAKRKADTAGVVLNMHQSYSSADVAADRLKFGRDPLLYLADIDFLDSNITLAHANYLTDEECKVLLEGGTSLAKAPAASMMWARGAVFTGGTPISGAVERTSV